MPICEYCNKKKVNIIPYKCKCGLKMLCTYCRYAENHNCIFDYKKEGKLLIQENNPQIITKKVINF